VKIVCIEERIFPREMAPLRGSACHAFYHAAP
jgi:hypothetical protein